MVNTKHFKVTNYLQPETVLAFTWTDMREHGVSNTFVSYLIEISDMGKFAFGDAGVCLVL